MSKSKTATFPIAASSSSKAPKRTTSDGSRPARTRIVQADYLGDDDHPGPGDSDVQVGEAFVATYVNAIARSTYWNDSAIIIAWDDGGGFYDHVPPTNFEQCTDGFACGDGQRLPFIVISPYAATGAVVHDYSDTASVSKFVETVFGVPPLASLPDEAASEPYGPRDYTSNALSDLADAFDQAKLTGGASLNPASAAQIPDNVVNKFPSSMNCKSLGIRIRLTFRRSLRITIPSRFSAKAIGSRFKKNNND